MAMDLLEPIGEAEAAIGKRFKEARDNAGFTLRALAEAIDVSVNTIRWHEVGSRVMPTEACLKAARLFKVDAHEIGASYRFYMERGLLEAYGVSA